MPVILVPRLCGDNKKGRTKVAGKKVMAKKIMINSYSASSYTFFVFHRIYSICIATGINNHNAFFVNVGYFVSVDSFPFFCGFPIDHGVFFMPADHNRGEGNAMELPFYLCVQAF